jgi:transposase
VDEHEIGKLIMTIEGAWGPLTAYLIVQIGDPARFDSPGAIASYVDVIPQFRQSGRNATRRGLRSRWGPRVAAQFTKREWSGSKRRRFVCRLEKVRRGGNWVLERFRNFSDALDEPDPHLPYSCGLNRCEHNTPLRRPRCPPSGRLLIR